MIIIEGEKNIRRKLNKLITEYFSPKDYYSIISDDRLETNVWKYVLAKHMFKNEYLVIKIIPHATHYIYYNEFTDITIHLYFQTEYDTVVSFSLAFEEMTGKKVTLIKQY